MALIKVSIIGAGLICLAACGYEYGKPAGAETPQPEAVTALATTRQIMLGITAPASDVVFGVGVKEPADEAEWEKIEASAISLAESALLLKNAQRRVDAQDWLKHVDALAAASQVAAKAAHEKNVAQVLEAGNQIYETCDACHKEYMAARGGV